LPAKQLIFWLVPDIDAAIFQCDLQTIPS
jgi:hypothetical protein